MDRVIFTKYSNERAPRFSIRTEILEENGRRRILKTPAAKEAKEHIDALYTRFELLREDLRQSPLCVNPCTREKNGASFPWRGGETLEERLDALLEAGDTEELIREIERYFAMFAVEGTPGCDQQFQETEDFAEVFGHLNLTGTLYCRQVSDIDMIFSNVIETEAGPELIDYEWTFAFPVPVRFIQYRCLHYYIEGTARRDGLKSRDLFGHFKISAAEQEAFAKMERRFQQYMLGSCTPLWKLYDSISEGVTDLSQVYEREKEKKRNRTVEIYFDDGEGYRASNCEKRRVSQEGPVTVMITPGEGTRAIRIDPCSGTCVVRVLELTQGDSPLDWTSNGLCTENGDLIFDTEDPQIYIQISAAAPVTFRFLAEPMTGLTRELILNQYGNLHWLTKTPLWSVYKLAKRVLPAHGNGVKGHD